MNLKFLVIVYIIVAWSAMGFAQNWEFCKIDENDGLSNNFVLAISQLHNGSIVVISSEFVDLIDNDNIKNFKKNKDNSQPLDGYNGAYHIYIDNLNNLWIKDYKCFWCFDKDMNLIKQSLPDSCNDFFIDDFGKMFFVAQNPNNQILDLKTLDNQTFEFYSSGKMICKNNDFEISVPLDSFAKTSLVVSDTINKKFYQLIDGCLCIEYDIVAKSWTEIFRAEKLYTISLVDNKTALIVSKNGLWKIDLKNRKVSQLEQVLMNDKSYISSSRINSVFTDDNGTIWYGTFDHGVLKGYKINNSKTFVWWISIVASLILAGFWWWSKRQGRNRQRQKNIQSAESGNIPKNNPKIVIDNDFVEKVRNTILENINKSGYTIEKLSQDLCMERTGLYKKLVATCGQTPTIFMRRVRLMRAAELIVEGKMNITEISEQTGFSSASYMAKCFAEETGKKPSEIHQINDVAMLFQQ